MSADEDPTEEPRLSRRTAMKVTGSAVLAGTTVASAAMPAAAKPDSGTGNPTFKENKCDVSAVHDDGCITIHVEGTGVGSDDVVLTVSADVRAEYACMNNGGNFPSDPKKQTVEGPVSNSTTLESTRSGRFSKNLPLCPPPSTLDCPGGQTDVLASVRYSNVKATLTRDGDRLDVIYFEPVSRTFYDV